MSRLKERGALSPLHHSQRRVPGCLIYAACALLATVQAGILPARADEFTVEHTGADIAAAAPYNLAGRDIGVAVVVSGLSGN
jgi:hypothetical protein